MAKLSDEVFKMIQDEINRTGDIPGSVDELNKTAQKVMDDYNNAPVKDFEGLSPHQMFMIMHKPFESGCPVVFKPGPDIWILDRAPVFRVYSVIIRYLSARNGIKLTPGGNLPRKIVSEIFALDLYSSQQRKYMPSRVLDETDFVPAAYTRVLMKIAGLVTVRYNRLSLTKKGMSTKDRGILYRNLLTAFAGRFHKGYLDGYGSESIGNTGALYIIYLLKQYGRESREASFYAQLYFRAFPNLMNEIQPAPYRDIAKTAFDCFIYRVFEKGLFLFGLTETEYKGKSFTDRMTFVKTTELFRQVF